MCRPGAVHIFEFGDLALRALALPPREKRTKE